MIFVICCLLLISLAACSLFSKDQEEISIEERALTSVAETRAVENYAQTVAAKTLTAVKLMEEEEEKIKEPQETESSTPEISTPTITPSPTITLTPTLGVPMVSVSMDTNCREGPGTQFDLVGALLVGKQAEVVGVSTTGGYWIIKNPNHAGECWLWDFYATITGPTDGLPRINPPPTPTPSFTPTPIYNWTGSWTTSYGISGSPHETYTIHLTQKGSSVTGSAMIGASTVNVTGSLSADFMTLTGTWSQVSPEASGPFVFKMININQFVGNEGGGIHEWCGYREGAGLPSPCMGP